MIILAGCDRVLSVTALTTGMTLLGLQGGGVSANALDIAPMYAGGSQPSKHDTLTCVDSIQRRRRWRNIEPTLGQRLMFFWKHDQYGNSKKHETLNQCCFNVVPAS